MVHNLNPCLLCYFNRGFKFNTSIVVLQLYIFCNISCHIKEITRAHIFLGTQII